MSQPPADYMLFVQTIQIQPLRTAIGAFKDMFDDLTLKFTSKGLSIVDLDKSLNITINVELNADKFDQFYCKPDKIIMMVSTAELFKVINAMEALDILTIYIDKHNYVDGCVSHLSFKYEHEDVDYKVHQSKVLHLETLNKVAEDIPFPTDVQYEYQQDIPSTVFQKVVRDAKSFDADRLEVMANNGELMFRAKGRTIGSEMSRNTTDATAVSASSKSIIHGLFGVKYLAKFVKCTPLSPNNMEIKLSNDLPLIVTYPFTNLGKVQLCLQQLPIGGTAGVSGGVAARPYKH